MHVPRSTVQGRTIRNSLTAAEFSRLDAVAPKLQNLETEDDAHRPYSRSPRLRDLPPPSGSCRPSRSIAIAHYARILSPPATSARDVKEQMLRDTSSAPLRTLRGIFLLSQVDRTRGSSETAKASPRT